MPIVIERTEENAEWYDMAMEKIRRGYDKKMQELAESLDKQMFDDLTSA